MKRMLGGVGAGGGVEQARNNPAKTRTIKVEAFCHLLIGTQRHRGTERFARGKSLCLCVSVFKLEVCIFINFRRLNE